MPPPDDHRLRLLISFSPEDQELKEQLVRHLQVLVRFAGIELWTSDRVRAGDDWRREVDAALDRADVALLLISADFLASDFLQDVEVPKLFKRRENGGLRVLPVLLRSCHWEAVPWLRALRMLPAGGSAVASFAGDDMDKAMADIAREIENPTGGAPPAATPHGLDLMQLETQERFESLCLALARRSFPGRPIQMARWGDGAYIHQMMSSDVAPDSDPRAIADSLAALIRGDILSGAAQPLGDHVVYSDEPDELWKSPAQLNGTDATSVSPSLDAASLAEQVPDDGLGSVQMNPENEAHRAAWVRKQRARGRDERRRFEDDDGDMRVHGVVWQAVFARELGDSARQALRASMATISRHRVCRMDGWALFFPVDPSNEFCEWLEGVLPKDWNCYLLGAAEILQLLGENPDVRDIFFHKDLTFAVDNMNLYGFSLDPSCEWRQRDGDTLTFNRKRNAASLDLVFDIVIQNTGESQEALMAVEAEVRDRRAAVHGVPEDSLLRSKFTYVVSVEGGRPGVHRSACEPPVIVSPGALQRFKICIRDTGYGWYGTIVLTLQFGFKKRLQCPAFRVLT